MVDDDTRRNWPKPDYLLTCKSCGHQFTGPKQAFCWECYALPRPTTDAVEHTKEVARLRALLRLAPAPPIHADVWDHNLYCEWYRRRCAALKEGEG